MAAVFVCSYSCCIEAQLPITFHAFNLLYYRRVVGAATYCKLACTILYLRIDSCAIILYSRIEFLG